MCDNVGEALVIENALWVRLKIVLFLLYIIEIYFEILSPPLNVRFVIAFYTKYSGHVPQGACE